MMSTRLKNGLMIAAVTALAVLPLVIAKQLPAGPDGTRPELFKGTDDQATSAIRTLVPGYKPWFQSIYKTPGPEIDSLLFALQAAIGAGFIGYYVGYSRGRAKESIPKPVAGDATQHACRNGFHSAGKAQKTISD